MGTASPRSITNFGSFAINGTAGSFTDYFLNGTRTGTTAVDSNGFTSEAVGSSTPFRVITNGSERLRITSDGKIGIGDATPENTLTIKNIGSFEGDANSFYLGSNFTGTGQNYTGSNKHAQRFFFNNAASNGYLRYENTGTTGTAGSAITWQERLRITSDGHLLHGVTADEDTSGNGGLRFINSGDIQIDGDQTALVFRSTNNTAQLQSAIEWWNENGAGVQSKIPCDRTAVSQHLVILYFIQVPM